MDLRPFADHPKITTWVYVAPISNGRIEGKDIDRLPENVRKAAADMAPFFRCHTKYCVTMYKEKALNPIQTWLLGLSAIYHYTTFDMASQVAHNALLEG